MSYQSYFVVRSSDRNKDQNPQPNDIYFDGQSVGFTNTNIRTIEAESVNMFYDVPNINPRNNVMVLDTGFQSYPITIETGYYNYPALAFAIQTALNGLGLGAFSFVWDVPKQRYDMVSPIPVFITKYPLQRRDLAQVVGFSYNQAPSISVVGGSADLAYTRDIYVISDSLHRHKRNDDQTTSPFFSNILFVVPVYENGPVGRANQVDGTPQDYYVVPRNIYYIPSWMKQIAYNPQEQLSSLRVYLLDDQGEPLYMRPNSEDVRYRLSLKLSK